MRSAIAQAADRLAAAGVPSPRVDAVALAEHALGVPQLILAVPPPVPAGFEGAYDTLVRRREAREPLQHIVGYARFRRLNIRVEPGVFVPRPETEVVAGRAVEEALRLIAAGRTPLVADLCTGSGVLALSVEVEASGSRVVAVDIDPAAVSLARENAARLRTASTADLSETGAAAAASEIGVGPSRPGVHGTSTGPGGIRVEVGDVADPALLSELAGAVDVVISNPPYIPAGAVPLEPEVAEHDPPRSLFGGGGDGLGVPREAVAAAARLLRAGGLFVMEHADVQGAAVRDLVDRTGAFEPATTHRDLTGRDRYVLARRR